MSAGRLSQGLGLGVEVRVGGERWGGNRCDRARVVFAALTSSRASANTWLGWLGWFGLGIGFGFGLA